VVNKSAPMLPFQIDNASVRVENQTDEGVGSGEQAEAVEEENKGEDKRSVVKQDVRLDNRVIDLRVPAN